jgi:putative transposase
MESYRHGSHSVFSVHLHLVWITKYRKRALTDEVIKAYTESQQHEQDDGFRIEGEAPPLMEPPSS